MEIVKDVIVVGAIVHWATHIFAVVGVVTTARAYFRRRRPA